MPKPKPRTKTEELESRIQRLVGGRIKKVRNEQGLSQVEFAEKFGMSYQQLHKYETGEQALPVARLARIAAMLNSPIEVFVRDLDGGLPPLDLERPATRLQLEMNRLFNEMGDAVKQACVDFLRIVVSSTAGFTDKT